MSLNLHAEVSGALNDLVQEQTILIYTYAGQVNVRGEVSVQYNDPVQVLARLQLESPQNLQHLQNIDMTLVYRRFYINSYTLSGLNRQIGTGGDYIVYKNIKHKIIQVLENFENGYVCCVGCQSN